MADLTITAGQSIYQDATTKKMLKADADLQASAASWGIALHGATLDQPISYQDDGEIQPGATLAVGETYCVSTTAGGIAPIADLQSGDFVTILFVAISTTVGRFIRHVTGIAKA